MGARRAAARLDAHEPGNSLHLLVVDLGQRRS
jgi:hypothetical protein